LLQKSEEEEHKKLPASTTTSNAESTVRWWTGVSPPLISYSNTIESRNFQGTGLGGFFNDEDS